MLRSLLLCALCTFFLPLFSVGATAAPSPQRALVQSRAQAQTLYAKGDYEGAYQLYMRLLREEPDNDEINYGLALAATRAKRYSQALLAFERLTDRWPANAELRRSLADVYLRLGDKDSARRELGIARQYDPTLTEERLEDILDTLQSAQSRVQAHGRISGGIMYDSNANQGPASERMRFGKLPGEVWVKGVKRVESGGAYLNGMLDLSWRLSEDSPWRLVSDMAFFKRWNSNPELTVNNRFTWGRAALGVRHGSPTTLSELRFRAESADQHPDQRVHVLGPEGAFVWAVLPHVQLISRAALEQRAYALNIGRDGLYWWAGQYVRILSGARGHEMTFGLRAMGAAVDNKDFNYTGLEANLRLRLKITDAFCLAPFASLRREKYSGPATALDRDDRGDTVYRTGIVAVYNLTPDLQLETGVEYVDSRSCSPLYTYNQSTVNMGVAWSF